MDTYSAVRTTGIYCRPGCPARPNPENVRRFSHAAAAEAAGFRACLRCRPYRTSDATPIADDELVCRAVQLILAGALDQGTEPELAGRLGVSARHLRRLFDRHVGATPDQVARSRRAHFARRLLDDTDMTVTQVAFAAGFGSVRQLNRACQDIFGEAPTVLRARRHRADRLAADGGLLLRLPAPEGLDWEGLTAYFAARAIPGVEAVSSSAYRRTIVVDGHPGVIEVERGVDDLVLRAHLPRWDGLIHLVERVRRLVGLDQGGAQAVDQLSADPVLGALVAENPGRRVAGCWDPFEIAVRAIIGQQVSVKGATTVTGRLVARCGTEVPGLEALGLSHTFPPAAVLARADLSGIGLTTARIDAIRELAVRVDQGRIRLDGGASLEELVASLSSIRGVGPWTAHYVALRLGERDAFPADDLGLRRALAAVTGDPSARLDEHSERWRPWRALAAVHLWSVGESRPDSGQLGRDGAGHAEGLAVARA